MHVVDVSFADVSEDGLKFVVEQASRSIEGATIHYLILLSVCLQTLKKDHYSSRLVLLPDSFLDLLVLLSLRLRVQ